MLARADHKRAGDTGLFALVVLLRFFGFKVHVDRVRERFGKKPIGPKQMVRCAKDAGLRARVQKPSQDQLTNISLPGIAGLRDGGFMILGKVDNDSVLIHHAMSSEPERITRAQFESMWDGRVVLMARPRTWTDVGRSVIQPFLKLGCAICGFPRQTVNLVQRAAQGLRSAARKLAKPTLTSSRAEQFKKASVGDHAIETAQPTSFATANDMGLAVLVMMLRIHSIGADAEQIRHRSAAATIGVNEMLRSAKELGLKARVSNTTWDRLSVTPLPGIAVLRDGGFLILGKVGEDKVLVQNPTSPRPEALSREQFEAQWDGRLVLMARRASLADLTRRFDITWFLGAIYKYRRLLSEVLIASFFLQLFALVSPLFFQVVIDKVLVHRSMSTLDVLAIGLLGISVFEAILGGLRTYLFAHTTNRIDVELGARLFRHLLALPIAYFQARRVGDSVARVRELENIRQFLTSSALTLVIDLVFTFVFLAVMLYYSPQLTFVVLAGFPFYIAISAGVTPIFRHRLDEKFRRGAENQARRKVFPARDNLHLNAGLAVHAADFVVQAQRKAVMRTGPRSLRQDVRFAGSVRIRLNQPLRRFAAHAFRAGPSGRHLARAHPVKAHVRCRKKRKTEGGKNGRRGLHPITRLTAVILSF